MEKHSLHVQRIQQDNGAFEVQPNVWPMIDLKDLTKDWIKKQKNCDLTFAAFVCALNMVIAKTA